MYRVAVIVVLASGARAHIEDREMIQGSVHGLVEQLVDGMVENMFESALEAAADMTNATLAKPGYASTRLPPLLRPMPAVSGLHRLTSFLPYANRFGFLAESAPAQQMLHTFVRSSTNRARLDTFDNFPRGFLSTVVARASARGSGSSAYEQRLQAEKDRCNKMRISELKKELAALLISTNTFIEKSEFVNALAEARANGVVKSFVSYGPTDPPTTTTTRTFSYPVYVGGELPPWLKWTGKA